MTQCFTKTVIGTAAYNLDTYLMSNDTVNYLLNKNSGDIAVIEGVMGFYDGFSFTEKGSTHELSEITDTDVISCCKLPWYEPVRNGFGERV